MAKELKGTKTHDNLKDAFAGESQANRRYLWMAKMADIEKNFPEGLEWLVVYDSAEFIEQSIKEVIITLIEALLLVMHVLPVVLGIEYLRRTPRTDLPDEEQDRS